MNAFALWKPEAVKVTEGADQIGTFKLTPHSLRTWRKNCGGHLLTKHPGMGMTDVCVAILPELVFKPAFHVHDAESLLPLHNALPKVRDMPKEGGGSGETMPE